jgi:hypothetical protein
MNCQSGEISPQTNQSGTSKEKKSYFHTERQFQNIKEPVILTERDQPNNDTILRKLSSEQQSLSTFPLGGAEQGGSKQTGNRKCISWPQSIKYTQQCLSIPSCTIKTRRIQTRLQSMPWLYMHTE